MKTSSRQRSIIVVLTLLALAALPSSATANHAWGSYHWARTSNPFSLQLGDNVTNAWDSYLRTTSGDWSKSSVLDTTIVSGGARSKNCRPTSGRVSRRAFYPRSIKMPDCPDLASPPEAGSTSAI